ncbi:MAG: hypothetical protein IJL97_03240, partial [Lachnospiraceae bacterium]|nr:hypothetical protein [Lachnospiraceae bacterium]
MSDFLTFSLTPAGAVFKLYMTVVMLQALFIVMESFIIKRSGRYKAAMILNLVLIGFFCTIVYNVANENDITHSLQSVVAIVLCRMPIIVFAAVTLFSQAVVILSAADIKRYRKSNITDSLIKEMIDDLPAGIMISDDGGTVLMSNLKMNSLARALTGTYPVNSHDLMNALKEQDDVSGDRNVLPVPDLGTWQFMRERISAGKNEYDEITAFDMTKQYELTKDLEEKNVRLKDIRKRMDEYSAKADELIISEEILKARTAIHDEAGHVLLTGRYYLEHPDRVDPQALFYMLKRSNDFLLREAEEEEGTEDPLREARSTAKAIGIDIVMSGDVLLKGPDREILARAVKECAVNAVKHADAKHLFVDIGKNEGRNTVRISNDGKAPEGPAKETGGLYSLRHIAEAAGCSMKISWDGKFELTITFGS